MGGSAIVLGRTLPVLAYGYVGYDLVRRSRSGEKIDAKKEAESLVFMRPLSEYGEQAGQLYAAAKIGQLVLKELVT